MYELQSNLEKKDNPMFQKMIFFHDQNQQLYINSTRLFQPVE